jgi:hypothetical protein
LYHSKAAVVAKEAWSLQGRGFLHRRTTLMQETPKLRFVDRFQIVTTVLFVVLGLVIIGRAALLGAPIFAYVVGAAFTALGVIRARLIVHRLRERGEPPSSASPGQG